MLNLSMRALLGLVLVAAQPAWAEAPAALAAPLPLKSSPTVLPVQHAPGTVLTVTPDHANWLYAADQAATLRIRVALDPYPAAGVAVRYRLGPEMLDAPEQRAVVPVEGLVLTVPAPAQPGFVRCNVQAQVGGRTHSAMATIGFAPAQLLPTQTEPADFDAFWAAQQAVLARVPTDLRMQPAPELSTPKVEVFHLSFANIGGWAGPSRFYGVLAVPRGDGPRGDGQFPALLNVPGAGVRGYSGNIALAEQGLITLQVGIHGIPVNLPAEVYDQLGRGALAEYPRFRLDDRLGYYYRRVYLGALRASQVLAEHPKWNRRQLLVSGSSQGGQLSIVVAALNPRITALAASYPAYSDVSGYLHDRAGGWPGLFRLQADGQRSDAPVEPKLATSAYYDTVNFARRVKVPGHYFFGFNDEVTPATSTYTAYNVISAPKQLLIAPEQRHATDPLTQGPRIRDWIVEHAHSP